MYKIDELIKTRKASELIPTTVRITAEISSFAEELAEQFGLSRQEALSTFITDGVVVAKDRLKLDEDGEYPECAFHLLNTNKRYNANDTKVMISEGIAAAFYKPWKNKIDQINENDLVFLYENGVGIVAYGYAGTLDRREYEGNSDEMHFRKLDKFKKLEKPLTAKEIKEILAREVVFLKTLTPLPDGEKIVKALETRSA